jgi:uncharacterized protein
MPEKCLENPGLFRHNNTVAITYDPAKRERTLRARGLDFANARQVFVGPNLEVEDLREGYAEVRTGTSSA